MNAMLEVQELTMLKKIVPAEWPKERMQWLWDNIRTQSYAFDDSTKDRADIWLQQVFAPNNECFEFEDSGYAAALMIRPSLDAQVHFVVWDRSASEFKINSCGRELTAYLFNKFGLNRLTAIIPDYNKRAIRLAVVNGYRYEGALRQYIISEGKFHDAIIYGLLRSEWKRREEKLCQ